MDDLLKTTSQANQIEETGTKPSKSLNVSSDTTTPDSTHSPKQSQGDSPHISDNTHHSRLMDKSTSTAPHDSETSSQELNQSKVQNITLPSHASTRDSQMLEPMTSIAVDTSSESAYKTMIHCHDKLVTALSSDILSISGILVANEFIPPGVSSKMLLPTLTPQEKATSLVIAITEKIKLAPDRFQELIKILSEQICSKDIVPSLSSHVSYEEIIEDTNKDIGVIVSTDQKYAICEGHMYTVWASLDPDDKIDLEARLLTEAEKIGVKFAHLCTKARDSFEHRAITPQILADTLKDLTIYKPGSSCHDIIPLLNQEGGTLMRAQSVREIFDALRPHMSFFNYEILQFLIEGKGSEDDKVALATYLKNFTEFCKRHVFEVPFTNGNKVEGRKHKQKLHIKVTEHFKAAFLIKSTTGALPSTGDKPQDNKVCSSKLGISLEDAKSIQRKLANILDLNPSSLFLDSIWEGSIMLTFLLPMCVSLAGLDHNPEIALLSSNGIIILCGPPGKPERKELIPNGIIMRWSPPEYGCDSLGKYVLYYQKKCETATNEWKKIDHNSKETHMCVPNLSVGDTYVFKVCRVSHVGTVQYSNESDPIILYNSEISVKDIYTIIITRCYEITALALSLADPYNNSLTSAKKTISENYRTGITLASNLSDQAMILSATIHKVLESGPEKFQEVLSVISNESLTDSVVAAMQSVFYHSVCIQYAGYLKFLYANLHSKQTSSDQWPPSTTHKFFRLAMIKAGTVKRGHIHDEFLRMTITGKVDDILRQKYPIELKNIILETPGPRKVILLEGAPGCGKSTLSVYICQQWEKGQLFSQFKLVILIRLRDPAVKNAMGLADLLPCSNAKTAQLLAGIMMEMKCQNVLFILDGWDELPYSFRKKSIFGDLVSSCLPSSNPLSKGTVIVTSRPIASGDLHHVVSSRVEILGFTAEELHQFFTECLNGDIKAVNSLLERIEENPEVAGSCYLPLNATILVHLFKNDRNTLPTTLYGIFSSLILNCIKRHLKLRTQYKNVSIESLDQLPEFAKEPFLALCRLAYDGVMADRIIFTSLPADVNTLSLLQGVESFIGREKAVSHNFLHLSIQELLAAWYIATQLPPHEQVSKFNQLFNKSRFSAVFRFYAAITKLKTPGTKDVVINVVKKYSIYQDKVLMVSLLHCLYEAQDPSLCVSVTQQLHHGLDLSSTTLTPSDCHCIGYFLAHICKMAVSELKVSLKSCSIGDQGCKYLVSGLHKYLDGFSVVITLRLDMDMGSNAIGHLGVHHLSTLLKIGCTNFLDLINNNLVSEEDTIHAPFGTFAEQLKHNTTLRELRLTECGLNSQSAESLAETLTTNKYLKRLRVSNNSLCDDGIQHLAHALRVNQGLEELLLESCGMTDVGAEYLSKALQCNKILTSLFICNVYNAKSPNRITEKIIPVSSKYLKYNCTLIELVVPGNLWSSTASIETVVNAVRRRSRLPLIKVKGI